MREYMTKEEKESEMMTRKGEKGIERERERRER